MSDVSCPACKRAFSIEGAAPDRPLKCPACNGPLGPAAGDGAIAVRAEGGRFFVGRFEIVRALATADTFEGRDGERRVRLVVRRDPFPPTLAVAATLKNPGIAGVVDIGTERGTHYAALEWLEGSTLAELIARAPLPPKEAAPIFAEAAAALHQAHSFGAIHGSLSPETLVVSASKRVTLADVGLRAGTMQDDVAALGGLLYQAISGRRPSEAAGAPPLVSALGAVCTRAMDPDPARRYPTAQAIEADLRAYVSGGLAAPAPKEEPAREGRPAWMWLVATVAALLVIVIGALWRGHSARAERVKALREKLAAAERDGRLDQMALIHDEIASADPALAIENARRASAIRTQIEQERVRAPAVAALERARAAVSRTEAAQRDGYVEEPALRAPVKDLLAALAHPSTAELARIDLADYAWRQLLAAEREEREVASWRMLVESFADGRYDAELAATGTVDVTVTPRTARVLLDGQEISGKARASIGIHLLTAQAEGYRDARVLLRVQRGATTSASIRLYRHAEIGDDFVHVPASATLVGRPPQAMHVDDFFIRRRPFPARTWEEAAEYADSLTREANARGDRVTYRLPSVTEWEKAARGASVYGVEDIGAEWCSDPAEGSGTRHAIRAMGATGVVARSGDEGDVATFRILRIYGP